MKQTEKLGLNLPEVNDAFSVEHGNENMRKMDVHTHLWGELAEVPPVFPPAAHSHPWGEVTQKPAVFPPATHGHAWSEVSGKPGAFTPAAHAASHKSGGSDALAAKDLGAASLSSLYTVTFKTVDWKGSSTPYSYVYNNGNIRQTSAIEILPGASVTAVQLKTMQKANMIGGVQTAGSITILAYGERPSVDLPIQLILRGDL